MEPAGERREHYSRYVLPCWVGSPQWSPPVNGGSNHQENRVGVHHHIAAMEPAGERREQRTRGFCGSEGIAPPQWSPPVNGGSSVPVCRSGAAQ